MLRNNSWDLVLVPRRSCHHVINNGGLTTKLSWSRTTVYGPISAFHHELPNYRRSVFLSLCLKRASLLTAYALQSVSS